MSVQAITRAFCAGALALCAAASGAAQEAGDTLEIELNAAGPSDDGGCRLTFLATNRSARSLGAASFEVVLFDGAGTVAQVLTMDFGALPSARSRVRRFDIPGTDCAAISRVLVNGAARCTGADGAESEICRDGLVASSRTAIGFGL